MFPIFSYTTEPISGGFPVALANIESMAKSIEKVYPEGAKALRSFLAKPFDSSGMKGQLIATIMKIIDYLASLCEE